MDEQNPLKNFFYSENHRFVYKWKHYLDHYHKHFSVYRDKALLGQPIKMLEIGVFRGGSLQMWQDYFGTNLKLIGMDIEPYTKRYESENVFIEIGDQNDPHFLKYVIDKYGPFDIILDDGGHRMDQQITSLKILWDGVKCGGIYLCEDTHTSYWSEYGGSLHGPDTFMEFSKLWVDKLNFHHSRGSVKENDPTLLGIHYYDSMVFFDKAPNPLPKPTDEMHGQLL